MAMDVIGSLAKIISRQWSVVMTAPGPFGAAVLIGCFLGWAAAWLILRQRLAHHRELIDYYKEVIAEKAPNAFVQRKTKTNGAMGLGVALFVLGLLFIGMGGAIIYNLSVAQSATDPPQGKDRTAVKDQLQKFYVEVGQIITRGLPKDISVEDFQKYGAEADAWATNSANWIGQNMSIAARERFLDRTGMLASSYSGAVNEKHNAIISNLTRMRQNLLVLIESGAWDKP